MLDILAYYWFCLFGVPKSTKKSKTKNKKTREEDQKEVAIKTNKIQNYQII